MFNSTAVKPEEFGLEEDADMLDVAERKKLGSVAAPLNCMSLDRSDVQRAARESCTKMANPTQGSRKRPKKAVRHLRGVDKVTRAMRAWNRTG